jgi:glycosyltransferase involved in cell wall biosynthesis
MANQVYVCGTLFHIYVSILKILNYKKTGSIESLLIINDHTPGINNLIEQIKNNNYFTNVLYVPFFEITYKMEKNESLVKRAVFRKELSVKYVEENSSVKEFYSFVKDSEINLFYNLGLVSSFFLIKFKSNYFRMIEDGNRNYHSQIGAFTAFKRKYIIRTVIGEGRDNEIKTIEVQSPQLLPEIVRHKGVKLDLDKLKRNLSLEEKNTLLSIFLAGNKINTNSSKNLLLITQPLSEDRFISEKEKISIYNNIISKHIDKYVIYLKAHPRELTKYEDYIDSPFILIPKSFPLELLDFLDNINFDLGITIFSSALNNIKCVTKKEFLGKEYLNIHNKSLSIKLSVVIITYNEEKNIERCILSIKSIADEIVIVDSFSTDKTEEICLKYGVKFIKNPFEGYIEQKNFALTCATNNHILSLDADEALSVELKESILKVKSNWKFDGYYFNRFNNYCGQWIYHSNWYPDRKLRLFDRRKGEWGGINPHDEFIPNKKSTRHHLKGDLLHWVLPTYVAHIDKANKFSTIAANEAFKSGGKASMLTILSHAFWRFIKSYFMNLGILDGYNGFVISSFSAYTVFLKYIKLRQLNLTQKGKDHNIKQKHTPQIAN